MKEIINCSVPLLEILWPLPLSARLHLLEPESLLILPVFLSLPLRLLRLLEFLVEQLPVDLRRNLLLDDLLPRLRVRELLSDQLVLSQHLLPKQAELPLSTLFVFGVDVEGGEH